MTRADQFRMAARGPQGQRQTIRFSMRADDQRNASSVGCDLLRARTGVDGWSPITVEWLNREDEKP